MIIENEISRNYPIDAERGNLSDLKNYLIVRRFLEIILIIFIIPFIIPFVVFLIIILYFHFDGKPFFTQKRSGRNGKPFIIYKFKTMKDNISENEDNFHHCIARETKIGSFLRKHRIDELPQLINILKGDMSIIGPRPEAYHHYQYFSERIENYHVRKSVPQGLTGLAQINYQYTDTIEGTIEKLKYDIIYISNISFRNDIIILIKTFYHVLFR